MKTRNVILLAVVALLGPLSATAQVPGQAPLPPPTGTGAGYAGDTYVAARAGVIIPRSSDLDGFDNGLALEAVVGRRMHPNVALEGAVGYLSIGASASSAGQSASIDVTAIPVTATLKLIAPIDRVELYGLAGAGVYFVSSKVEAAGYYSGNATDDGTSLGVTFGGGLSARLSPQVTLGAELKYLLGNVKLFGGEVSYDSLLIGGVLGLNF